VVANKVLPATSVHPPVVAGPQTVYDLPSKLGTGLHVEPEALVVQVWALHVVVVVVPEVETYQLQAEENALQAIESLLPSVQADINLQVPTVGVVVLPGVKAHIPSEPPPLQASLFVYDEQVALTIQFVPSETHPVPVRATEQAALVASLKSPQALTLHALVPVVYPTGKS
jgi:hypothetical protein